MLNIRKEIYMRKRKMEQGDEFQEDFDANDYQLLPLKKDMFKMPVESVML